MRATVIIISLCVGACSSDDEADPDTGGDAGEVVADAGPPREDAGPAPDAAVSDAMVPDAEGARSDANVDAGFPVDAAMVDVGPGDVGAPDGIQCDGFVTLDTFEDGDARLPILEQSGDHAAVIWQERGGHEAVAVARYDFAADAWTPPFYAYQYPNPPFSPVYEMALDADGDVAAAWREVDTGVHTVHVRLYDAALDQWSDAEIIYDSGAGSLGAFLLNYDRATGDLLFFYSDTFEGRRSILFMRRDGSGGWTAPEPLEAISDAHISTAYAVDFNDAGQGVVSWIVETGGVRTFFAVPYENGDFRRDGKGAVAPLSAPTALDNGVRVNVDVGVTGRRALIFEDSTGADRNIQVYLIDSIDVLDGPYTVLSESGRLIDEMFVTVGGDDVVTAMWSEQTRGGSTSSTPFISALSAGAFGPDVRLGGAHASVWPPSIAGDVSGRVSFVMTDGANGLFGTRSTGPGVFAPQSEITGRVGSTGQNQLAAHSGGDFLVSWEGSPQGSLRSDINAARCR